MRTLYIHGLDSSPRPDKIALLKGLGLEVYALHLDYRQEREASYEILKKHAQENEIEFIIGSSLGGLLGFWLSEALQIPCLLFNPALTTNFGKDLQFPATPTGACPTRLVVLGAKDETVNPVEARSYLEKLELYDTKQRIVTCNWLGHTIDLATLREMTIWSLAALK